MKKYIVSASRRTDIPAFHKEWFLKQLDKGYCIVKNPFYQNLNFKVELSKESVHTFVFWSKNFTKFIEIINELKKENYGIYIHYTINNYEEPFENLNESLTNIIESFKIISILIDKNNIVWRYDPIIISELTPLIYHINKFEFISNQLNGFVKKVYFSFVCFYKKVISKFNKFPELKIKEPTLPEKIELLTSITKIADNNNQKLYSCCTADVIDNRKIFKASCINAPELAENFGADNLVIKQGATRKNCGCYYSKDIGEYSTCKYNCLYCYAN